MQLILYKHKRGEREEEVSESISRLGFGHDVSLSLVENRSNFGY